MYANDDWVFEDLDGESDDFESFDEEEYFDELLDAELDLDEDIDLAEVLRGSLHESYGDATPDELDSALDNIFGSMSAAESFNFAKALRQIEQGASAAVSNPLVGQIARAAAPMAGTALGTLVGGPMGGALGSQLGAAAARALPAGGPKGPTAQPPGQAPPPVAGGSAAAAQGLVLSQQPQVLQSLLALAMGQHGKSAVNGVPVAPFMNMLGNVFTKAAEDADELMYLEEMRSTYANGSGSGPDPSAPGDRTQALYLQLMDSENAELEEGMDW